MLQSIARVLTRWSTRWVPDAWIIAVVLTVIAFLLAFFLSPGATPQDLPELKAARDLDKALTLVYYWGKGFWVLLSFAMQMCLIIMTGYIVAVSPPFRRLLGRLASLPKSPRGAIALMAFVSMALSFFNWGLSIVGSAVFSRLVAKRQRGVDYRLLISAAYLGMGTTWHSGLSASAPLLVATPGHFMQKELGIIDITQTIFHPFNLVLVAIVMVFMTIFVPMLHPRKEDVIEADPEMVRGDDFTPPEKPARPLPSERMEHSPVINIVIGVLFGLVFFWQYFTKPPSSGQLTFQVALSRINLDTVNFLFLTLGVLLHRTPASLLKGAREAGESIWGVVLQFPFYAGIFGIIQYSGLQDVIAGWFLAVAGKQTYPAMIYWYSGIVNYFVPSGGSKWAIEAPYVVAAGMKLGVPNQLTVLTYAWGDMMTDIIQPFWAIPLLSMARLNFRDIMGYCVMIFIVYFVLTTIAFLMSPLFF
jgi:short-chain fatty acids transporter